MDKLPLVLFWICVLFIAILVVVPVSGCVSQQSVPPERSLNNMANMGRLADAIKQEQKP